MKLQRYLAICCGLMVFPVLVMATHISANGLNADKNSNKYVCSESNPGSMCSASTTCGSTTSACNVDVKRSGGNSASATPSIPNAKGNASFCVKVGTTVTWQSSSKNTGFVLDFGPSSPFDPPDGAIMGGADRPVSVVAKRAGCYKYSVGACVSGTIYGMCGSSNAELVVTP
jgi:hypothetical protein